jgi:tRNA pseudouridine55 synthase
MQFLSGMDKTYEAEVVFGIETNTLDSAGEVTARHDMTGITIEQVRLAAEKLIGDILQIPPMVSAIRVDGKRLHELAREGIEIERKPRPVTVHSFDVQPTSDPLVVRIVVNVSSGTYVRTLAADLGTLLGGGAHLRNLKRTSIGDFTIGESHSPESAVLLSPITALRECCLHGKKVHPGQSWMSKGCCLVCTTCSKVMVRWMSRAPSPLWF